MARIILPVGLGTALSLLGDSTLYTVLPTHTIEAGISMGAVGALLGANRIIRVITSPVSGYLFDRLSKRWLFVLSLVLGAISSFLCAIVSGFVPLLLARLLWGLSWSGIWIGGTSILLSVSPRAERGKRIGVLQVWFFLGSAGGSLLGGFLTDLLSYRSALLAAGGLSTAGMLTAAIFLPKFASQLSSTVDGRSPSSEAPKVAGGCVARPIPTDGAASRPDLAVAAVVEGLNRLVLSGILAAIISLLVRERLTALVIVVSVSTLTGILNLGRTAASMASAVALGRLSDFLGDRWLAMAISLFLGGVGLHLLAYGQPWPFFSGLLLCAVAMGGIPVLTRSLAGDISGKESRGRAVGIIQTAGDLGSAIGPPLAFLLLPNMGASPVFNASAGAYALCLLLVFLIRRRGTPSRLGHRTGIGR